MPQLYDLSHWKRPPPEVNRVAASLRHLRHLELPPTHMKHRILNLPFERRDRDQIGGRGAASASGQAAPVG